MEVRVRTRSPNYPSMGLKEAVERARALTQAIGRNATSREVVAKGMGYSGLSGASAMAISALKKYGLLEGRDEDVRVSDRAMAILHPHSEAERREALREAALAPQLFKELSDRFNGGPLNEDLIRNYLMRNGYTPQAVPPVISAYRETIEFVRGADGGYDSAPESTELVPIMHAQSMPRQADPPPPVRIPTLEHEGVEIGGLTFKGVGFVKIIADPGLDTAKALDMAQTVIAMMRAELKKQELTDEELELLESEDEGK